LLCRTPAGLPGRGTSRRRWCCDRVRRQARPVGRAAASRSRCEPSAGALHPMAGPDDLGRPGWRDAAPRVRQRPQTRLWPVASPLPRPPVGAAPPPSPAAATLPATSPATSTDLGRGTWTRHEAGNTSLADYAEAWLAGRHVRGRPMRAVAVGGGGGAQNVHRLLAESGVTGARLADGAGALMLPAGACPWVLTACSRS